MIQTWLKAFADELTSVRSYVDPAVIEHEIATRTIRINVLEAIRELSVSLRGQLAVMECRLGHWREALEH